MYFASIHPGLALTTALRRVAVMFACVAAVPAAAAPSAPSATPAVYTVQKRMQAAGFAVDGSIEAVRQATVTAQVAGRVLEVRADAGQRVRAGELLLRLDARESAATDAAAQAQAAQASAAYERARQLRARGFISPAALDQAEAAYKAASGAAAATTAASSHATLVAPLAGVVGQRLVEPGDLATPGRPLLTVFDPGRLRVVVSVPQGRLAAARGGALVELPDGRLITPTRVEWLPTVDAASRTATARAYLPERLADAMPGMAVRVRFDGEAAMRITVPAAAILRRGEVTAVYVVGSGPPRLRQVRLGEVQANGAVEVLAGLSEGEPISLDPVQSGLAVSH